MKDKKAKLLGEGKFLKLWVRNTWEFVQRKNCKGVVIIAALTPDKKVIFVEQYRPPVKAHVIELPAGLVGDKHKRESMKTAAKRELFEETGWQCKKIDVLIEGPAASGMSGEEITFCLASNLVKKGIGGGDETEDIKTHEISLNRAESWLRAQEKKGKKVDPKIFTGLYFLKKI